jgi:hypothetical protein
MGIIRYTLFIIPILFFPAYKTVAQCTQNYLVNPSFESPAQANNNGNNFPPGITFNGWTMTNVVPANANPWNVIRVDGSGYGDGPNNAQNGLQYVDVSVAAGNIDQVFNLGCNATLTFSGYFSARGGPGFVSWTAQIDILNSSNTVVATSATRLFTSADQDKVNPDAVWYQLSGSVSLPAGTYKYRVVLGDFGNFDNAFLCADPGCLLPVKLKSFDAVINNCIATLKWSAESETNFDKYVVEYSSNGIDFTAIGSVNAASQAAYPEYSFLHQPPAGKVFYRLKMADIDNKISYSKTVALNVSCNKNTLLIYPNPVTDFLNISINTISGGSRSLASLYSTDGKLLFSSQLVNGTNTIDMRKATSGVYCLVVITDNEINTFKIIR